MIRRYPVLVLFVVLFSANVAASDSSPAVEKLLEASTTVLGQPIRYPTTGSPEITAVLVTMKPGEKTSTHLHEVPVFGYVLEGELTVRYNAHGKKIYKAGNALVEAGNIWHTGENTGSGDMRILAVFMGAEGAKNSVDKE